MFDVIVIGGAPAGENVAARAVRNRVEPFAGEQVATAFGEGGIDVRFSTSVQSVVRPEPGGPVTVRLAGGEAVDASRRGRRASRRSRQAAWSYSIVRAS